MTASSACWAGCRRPAESRATSGQPQAAGSAASAATDRLAYFQSITVGAAPVRHWLGSRRKCQPSRFRSNGGTQETSRRKTAGFATTKNSWLLNSAASKSVPAPPSASRSWAPPDSCASTTPVIAERSGARVTARPRGVIASTSVSASASSEVAAEVAEAEAEAEAEAAAPGCWSRLGKRPVISRRRSGASAASSSTLAGAALALATPA